MAPGHRQDKIQIRSKESFNAEKSMKKYDWRCTDLDLTWFFHKINQRKAALNS
jgi:hypothetical protein